MLFLLTVRVVHNGVGVNMLKCGTKRRRTTEEVQVEREGSKKKDQEMQNKLQELKAFEQQLHNQQRELNNGKEAAAVLNGLLKSGQIKQCKDGTWAAAQNADPKKQ